MSPFTSALFVTSLIACLAHAEHVSEIDYEEEADHHSFLQAAVQVEADSAPKEAAHAETAADYNLVDELAACESKEEAQPTAFIELPAPGATQQERLQSVHLTPATESEDPPGASVLRAFLLSMVVVIIVDSMRRWRLQDASKLAAATADSAQEAANLAEEAAWLAMVNAASTGNAVGFEKAISSKPSVSRTDAWGCTPLHFAAAGGSATITAELLKKGVEVDPLDASDETPLHFAARAGHAPICELLLGAGANINAVNLEDMTPFVVAGHANKETACSLLADRGAGVAGLSDEKLPPLVVSQLVRKVFAAL
jgi:hypothetical protein